MAEQSAAAAELIAFLRARLDEDERDARLAATSPHGRRWWWHGPGQRVKSAEPRDDVARVDPLVGPHIARHDPGRALEAVEAQRRLLAQTIEPYAAAPGFGGAGDLAWLQLRLLALPYADHSDYREEWRP
ncbi:hypothetical protein HNP84_001404 [Thermocatellispora tengchongensis]|uniref:Uncharacterized protein n=1 Tax=Thermocatellispora tengchongensis TaxID=1073253 RepID=A0A840P1C1_9ACTN|nr:DUF6221 family protein [Thermocatellispora tengchongensis]MBB5131691.1 hypothetical protein [Thermocatellispora tengchongensis]